MPRHRQNSLSASTPGQLQGRGGTEKLRVSRREGMLLSVIVLLAVAICAIALYKTGDPNIPRATGQQRRPGSQRTGDLPGSVSSYTKLIHRGKSFTNASVIRTREAGDARHDDQAMLHQDLAHADSGTEHEQHGFKNLTYQLSQEDDRAIPSLPARNPYAHAQAIQSPDGTPFHGRRTAMPAPSISSPIQRRPPIEPDPKSQPVQQIQSVTASGLIKPVPVTLTAELGTLVNLQEPPKQPVEPIMQHESARQLDSRAPGDPGRAHELEHPRSHLEDTNSSEAYTPASGTGLGGSGYQADHGVEAAVKAGTYTGNSTSDSPADSSGESPKAIKKRIADKIKDLQEQWHQEALDVHAPSFTAAMDTEKLHKHQSFIEDVLQNGLPSDRPKPTGPSISLHPIVRVDNISTSEFEFRFASEFGLQPVVISNSQNDWFSPDKFTLDELRRLIGPKQVRVKIGACAPGKLVYDTNACHSIKESDPDLVGRMWASLKATNLTEIGVNTYDEFLTQQIQLAEQGRYIYAHEISGGWLPEIETIIRQPKYFLNNVQDLDWRPNVDISERVRDTHFPSVFFGASGSSSPLHSDARMTRFWIMQLAGKKLLRLVPPADNWRGDASDSREFQPSLFTVDLMHPNFQEHPNMHNMIVYETILAPGDILFIPEGWGHQALNLEWTWMISSNYVDEHNIPNLLNFILYTKGPGEAYEEAQVDFDHFFLPINNHSTNLSNLPLEEYFERLTLEYAPISDAAKAHCKILQNLEVPPEEWRDHHSKRVMTVAFETNYVALAQWLYEQGVPLENDLYGRTMLKWVTKNGMERMESWMRMVMGIDESDKLEDIEEDNANSGVEPNLEEQQAAKKEQPEIPVAQQEDQRQQPEDTRSKPDEQTQQPADHPFQQEDEKQQLDAPMAQPKVEK